MRFPPFNLAQATALRALHPTAVAEHFAVSQGRTRSPSPVADFQDLRQSSLQAHIVAVPSARRKYAPYNSTRLRTRLSLRNLSLRTGLQVRPAQGHNRPQSDL